MGDHDALGHACGATGVHDDGDVRGEGLGPTSGHWTGTHTHTHTHRQTQ